MHESFSQLLYYYYYNYYYYYYYNYYYYIRSHVLIPAITDRQCGQVDRDILALPVRLGGLRIANPSSDANLDYTSSVKVTAPLVEQIVAQVHQLPEDSLIRSVHRK